MKRILLLLSSATAMLAVTCSCKNRTTELPYNLDDLEDECISIPYTENSGVRVVDVKLNGKSMQMIYDTGASGVSISLLEAKQMFRDGLLTSDDYLGDGLSSIANGQIVEHMRFRIKTLQLGNDPEAISRDIVVSVMKSDEAPVLLGNDALSQYSKIIINKEEKTIDFYK